MLHQILVLVQCIPGQGKGVTGYCEEDRIEEMILLGAIAEEERLPRARARLHLYRIADRGTTLAKEPS